MKAKTKNRHGHENENENEKKDDEKTTAKRGSILPILPMLGAMLNIAQCQLEELLRHNRAMESQGLYLAPYKYGPCTSVCTGVDRI